jgi:hypothetical protein
MFAPHDIVREGECPAGFSRPAILTARTYPSAAARALLAAIAERLQ